jgi:hypothetical protein
MIIRNLFKVTITLLVVAFCAFESQAQEQKDILINFEFIKSNGETNYKVKYKLNSILTDSIASVSHYFLSNGDTIVADSCTFEQCNLEIIDQNTIAQTVGILNQVSGFALYVYTTNLVGERKSYVIESN